MASWNPMSQGTEFMVDLETLGLRPGCVLLSIGACTIHEFLDPNNQFYQNISVESQPPSDGFHVNPLTEQWWSTQPLEARQALEVNQITLKQALIKFHDWIATYPEPYTFWAQGPHFDYSIYEEACRLTNTSSPFRFFMVRDTRTVYDLGGVLKHEVEYERSGLVMHHALSDCIEQTYRLIANRQNLLRKRDVVQVINQWAGKF